MASSTSEAKAFIEQLQTSRPSLGDDAPSWLKDMREARIKRFTEIGFPNPKDAEWRLTNVTPVVQGNFHFPTEKTILETRDFNEYLDRSEPTIVFVNGLFAPEYSNLNTVPPGLTIANLATAIGRHPKTLESFFSKYEWIDEDGFTALNRALARDGVFINVDDGTVLRHLIHVIYIVSGTNDDAIILPRNLFILGKSSQAEILESYISFSDRRYFTNAISEIYLMENAKLRYYKTQCESLSAFHVATARIEQEARSQVETFSFSTGAKIARHNLTVTLRGEGASTILNGLYAVSDHQLVDNHTAVEHVSPRCVSNQLYKGILDGDARAVFNGKIFVRREAQQTNSYQLNKNLLLSPGAQINTKPQLEIFADDVRCTHGATIGQLNDEELFYLQTRGIRKDFATRMLLCGFIEDVLNKVPNLSARTKIDELLTKVFPALKCKI